MSDEKRIAILKRASWVSITGNTILAIFKLVAGFVSGSLSVVADGIDSSGDVLISGITLYIATLLAKPPNIKFPYGYGKVETNATNAISFIIFFAGAQLALSSIKRLFTGETGELPGQVAMVAIVASIIGKLGLAWYQMHTGKKIKSNMLIANGKNMQGDVLISTSVLVGLLFTHYFKLPIIDTIAALLVSGWVIGVSIKIFVKTNLELMDANIDKSYYQKIFEIMDSIPHVKNPHRLRIRSIGHRKMINADIEIDGSMSLSEAHHISHEVERAIREEMDDVFDVAIHVEPVGDTTDEKDFGVHRDHL